MGKKRDQDEKPKNAGFGKGILWQPANRYRRDHDDDDHRDAGGPDDDDDRDSD